MFVIGKTKLLPLTATLVALAFFPIVAAAGSHITTNGFNQAGNILITDQFNNRVIEINPATNQIVWSFGSGNGLLCNPGPNRLNTPVFAIETANHDIMIVDQGNNRVIEVTQDKQIVFSYGALNNPNSAEVLPNNNVLIADENNNRVIEINRAGNIVWQYSAGISFAAFASRLPNGNTLITDSGNARIVEVTTTTPATILSGHSGDELHYAISYE